MFVKGDPDLDFAAVANAIGLAKGAGIDKIGIMRPPSWKPARRRIRERITFPPGRM